MEFNQEINRLTNRHIAKLLDRLAERQSIPTDVEQTIKAQFRMLQEDIIKNTAEIQEHDDRFNK